MQLTPSTVCLIIVGAMFLRLRLSPQASPDLVFFAGLTAFVVLGDLTPAEALAGFSSSAVFTLVGLLVVTASLYHTGVISDAGSYLAQRAHTRRGIVAFMSVTVAPLSAFMNNTPLVDVFIGLLRTWCRRNSVSVQEVMLPLSFLAILGGLCTLIGTSTTLLVNGMLLQHEMKPLTFFEIGYVGLPCAILGILYIVGPGALILRSLSHEGPRSTVAAREFLMEIAVDRNATCVGRLVTEWAKRPEFTIIRWRSGGTMTTEVPNDARITAGDRITCLGSRESLIELISERGIKPIDREPLMVDQPAYEHFSLVEVTISDTSPVRDTRVGESDFESRYDAHIVAVSSPEDRSIDNIRLTRMRSGDTLLVFAPERFVELYSESNQFAGVHVIPGTSPRQHGRRTAAIVLSAILLLTLTLPAIVSSKHPLLSSPVAPVLACTVLVMAFKCIRPADAREAVKLPLVITIASSIGIGTAITKTGAAEHVAVWFGHLVPGLSAFGGMICLYILASCLTEAIANAAVAAALFPVAIEFAHTYNSSPRPFVMAVAVAASASFLTSVGYQTNLMVQEPGRYSSRHYFLYGFPLALIYGTCAVMVIPVIWPF